MISEIFILDSTLLPADQRIVFISMKKKILESDDLFQEFLAKYGTVFDIDIAEEYDEEFTFKKFIKHMQLKKINDEPLHSSTLYPVGLSPDEMVTYLAHPWDEYIKEDHSSVKLHWLVDTAEVVVRWVCALLLAEIRYDNGGKLPKSIQEKFQENIARPTLGIWLNFVSELSKQSPTKPLLKGLFSLHGTCLNKEGLFPDDGTDVTSLLKLRNRIAHGGGTTLNQAKEYLKVFSPHLNKLLLELNSIMSEATLYASYKDTSYRLRGLESRVEDSKEGIDGPYIKVAGKILSLWPLVEFDVVRQLDGKGILVECNGITPQTYLRTDKQGVQYIPLGIEESYSITNKQKEFETIFALNQKKKSSLNVKKSEYAHDDFLKEARNLREERVGRDLEVESVKSWMRSVDAFDIKKDCRYIYGGPGLGKSMLIATIASKFSDGKKDHLFYYRFRGGDARNNKQSFVKLLRDSLISWECLNKVSKKVKDTIDTQEIIEDIQNLLDKIPRLERYKSRKDDEEIEVEPILRLIVDGLDEVLLHDSSILDLIGSFQKKGVITLIGTRLENGAEKLENFPWITPFVFDKDVNGLPKMSNNDIRGMLLEGISKSQRKELIKSDGENNEHINGIVKAIADKAAGLPLYIHLLINDIQKLKYSIHDADRIPDGLTEYYHELINSMGISSVQASMTNVITLLSLVEEPIDIEAISLALVLDINGRLDINDAKVKESLIKEVLLSAGSLLKQVKTPEGTMGYVLYHQSFKEFILEAEDDTHPLFHTLEDMKKTLFIKSTQWDQLPDSNLKNHLFRYGNHYTLKWRKDDGLEVVKMRLNDLEYLLERLRVLNIIEMERLVNEYEIVLHQLAKNEQEEFEIWYSFFQEKAHFLIESDEEFWLPNQTLFQLAYADGHDSPLSEQAETLFKEDKIKFTWLRKKNRPENFSRSGLLKVMRGHTGSIDGIEVLEEGRVLSYSDDKTLILWNDRGEIEEILRGHSLKINGVKVLKNGQVLSYDNSTLRVWNEKGNEVYAFDGMSSPIIAIEILDEERVISYAKDNSICLWDIKEKTFKIVGSHSSKILGMQITFENKVLTYSVDGTFKFWNSLGESEKIIVKLDGELEGAEVFKVDEILFYDTSNSLKIWNHNKQQSMLIAEYSDSILGMKILDGGSLLSYSKDARLQLWNPIDESIVYFKGHKGSITGVEVLKDGRILSYSDDKTLKIWSLKGKTEETLLGHTNRVLGVEILKDGKILSYSEDNSLRVWSSEGRSLSLLKGHDGNIKGIKPLSDERVLSYSGDKTLRIWSSKREDKTIVDAHKGYIKGAEILRDGRILTYSSDNTLRLWSANGDALNVLNKHKDSILGVKILDDERILSYSNDHTLRLWSKSGEEEALLDEHKGSIGGVEIFYDGRILSYSKDNTLRVWDKNGKESKILGELTKPIKGVKILEDNRVLSYSGDNILRVWSLEESESKILKKHNDTIVGVEVLTDGRVLSYSADKSLQVYNSKLEKEEPCTGHTGGIKGVKALKDGRILSYANDNTLRLWNTQGKEEYEPLKSHTKSILGVDVFSDGKILSYAKDNTLQLWSRSGTPQKTFIGHTSKIMGVKVLQEDIIASYSYDKTLRFWDDNGKCKESYFLGVESLEVFSMDRNTIIGSDTNNIFIYEFCR